MGTNIMDPALAAQVSGVPVSTGNGSTMGMAAPRALYSYAIPERYAAEAAGIERLGLVKLGPGEELMAAERAAGANQIKLAYALATESLRYIKRDGKVERLSTFDGSADRVWAGLDPIIRSLCCTAYGSLHSAQKEETQGFLASCEITV